MHFNYNDNSNDNYQSTNNNMNINQVNQLVNINASHRQASNLNLNSLLMLSNYIDNLWDKYQNHEKNTITHAIAKPQIPYIFTQTDLEYIAEYVARMDKGEITSVNKINNQDWVTNTTLKKCVLLYFKTQKQIKINADDIFWSDKVGLKNLKSNNIDLNFRCVPGSIIRYGSYISNGCIIMPSFINIGAFVGKNTMIDTWATVGSCAFVGENCHISGGTGIGGVLEPINQNPVIIENNCFIGARSEIAEGVLVEEGCVISMGVFIGASTKIINRETGEVHLGRIPKYSVVIPGSYKSSNNLNINCAIIIKTVDEKTRAKTSINELLRS